MQQIGTLISQGLLSWEYRPRVAPEGRVMAQVELNWVANRPGGEGTPGPLETELVNLD
jgi:hypothetical protein